MSPDRNQGGGTPRGANRKVIAPPGSASRDENWHGANEAKDDKLRRNNLQRQARGRGLELRHSAYGYALLDKTRKRVADRNDMTLDDIESWLARAVGRESIRDAGQTRREPEVGLALDGQ